MPYYHVKQFSNGLDHRKSEFTSPAGVLRRAKNVRVNPGAEIEKANSFLTYATVAGTKGLATIGNRIFVFYGKNDTAPPTITPPAGSPYTITTQMLNFSGSQRLDRLVSWDIYDGKVYVVVKALDGTTHHFYDGQHVPSGKGLYVLTYKSKMYSVEGPFLYFSSSGNCKEWHTDTTDNGAGFINVGAEDAEASDLVGLEVYYDKLAVFSRRTVQLWAVAADPVENALVQTLRYAGLRAPLSPKQYSNGDVLFLADSGVRSLRARDLSVTASVSDIGSPIDKLIQSYFRQYLPDSTQLSGAVSCIEPTLGRYWLALYDRIYVLTFFPDTKISAWSEIVPPFTLSDMATVGPAIVVRSTDNVLYIYDALNSADLYSIHMPVEIRMPFLDFDKPATFKQFTGIDVACEGVWRITAALDPSQPDVEEPVAIVTGPTFLDGRVALQGHSTHVSLRFYNDDTRAASLNSVMIHYEDGEKT